MTDKTPPRIENAPGIRWRPHRLGWEARWRARTDLVRRGYSAAPVRLWVGSEPMPADQAWISDRCNTLQAEMLAWGRGGIPVATSFEGNFHSLIICYQTDKDSSYRKLRYKTRENYDCIMRVIDRDHGEEPLAGLRARDFLRWHEAWSADGHISMAHSLMAMVRTLLGFGCTLLEDDDNRLGGHCARLRGILHQMKFKVAKPRSSQITAEQVIAVRAMAHEMKLPSIALAQALQFECTLRQKDVIGEWVPQSEPGISQVLSGGQKWLRGLQWSEIDKNLVLRHNTSKRGKDVEVDLRYAPMVLEELNRLGSIPSEGPVVVYEVTGLPYGAAVFRRVWREVATAAGIPKNVFNMDSRAGAITEGLTATGGDLDSVRIAATHSNIQTTQGYSRAHAERTANVMKLRVEHRNKR